MKKVWKIFDFFFGHDPTYLGKVITEEGLRIKIFKCLRCDEIILWP